MMEWKYVFLFLWCLVMEYDEMGNSIKSSHSLWKILRVFHWNANSVKSLIWHRGVRISGGVSPHGLIHLIWILPLWMSFSKFVISTGGVELQNGFAYKSTCSWNFLLIIYIRIFVMDIVGLKRKIFVMHTKVCNWMKWLIKY